MTGEDDRTALWRRKEWSRLLCKPGCLVLILPVLRQGRFERQALHRESGLSVNGASYHLRAMKKAGMIQMEGPAGNLTISILDSAEVASILDELGLDWRGDHRATKAWRDAQRQVEIRRVHGPQVWYTRQNAKRADAKQPLRSPKPPT